ncbi:MAG: hypothetical protein LBL94_05905 [Prevotellaceae bacterium]|jgi:hypothetical protein|nr:hypothetical protein [Prevotellaceae bacterium]
MKKLALTLVGSCIFAGLFAQKDLTTAQKSFQTSMVNFLREEGYSPSLDDDNWIKFKSEGKTYYITIGEESPFFVTLRAAGFTLQGENAFERTASLLACNDLTMEFKSVKLYCSDKSVSVHVEQFTRSSEDYKYVFARNLSVLTAAKNKFFEKYSKWKEELEK